MNQHCQNVTVDLRKALFGIAKALDNVGFESKNHGQRVTSRIDALECRVGRRAGATCVLIGVNSRLWRIANWWAAQPDFWVYSRCESYHHCQKGLPNPKRVPGSFYIRQAGALPSYPWVELKAMPISELEKELAAIVMLADRVDHLTASLLQIGKETWLRMAKRALLNVWLSKQTRCSKPILCNICVS